MAVRIDAVRAVTGGPQYRLRYPNGDLVSYVSIVFDARVGAGKPRPDREEVLAVEWFGQSELSELTLTDFTVELLSDPDVWVLAAAEARERSYAPDGSFEGYYDLEPSTGACVLEVELVLPWAGSA